MRSICCLLAVMAMVGVPAMADGGRLGDRSEKRSVTIRRLPPIDQEISPRRWRAEQPVNGSRIALLSYHKGIGTEQPRYEPRPPPEPLPLTNSDAVRRTHAANPSPIS